MYEQFYGLREKPFSLAPNPRFLFLSRRHREALAHLRYGLAGRPGMTMLVGEAGTGKTTLVRTAMCASDASASTVVHLSNPTLTRPEFYEYLAAGFGFAPEDGTSKTRFLKQLEDALKARTSGVLALIVDEAQALSHELLEEIRLLTNVCTPGERALTVVLAGQPELAERLRDASLRQLRQRISLRCELQPFDVKETTAYIASRVRIAGGAADALFTRDAVAVIHERSGGIPRLVNVICDNALVTGFAADTKPVGRDIVLEVCRDFELDGPGLSAVPAQTLPDAAAADSRAAMSTGTDGPDRNAIDARPLFSGFTRPRRFSFFQG